MCVLGLTLKITCSWGMHPLIESKKSLLLFVLFLSAFTLLSGCGYHYYTGPLRPEESQAASMTVADDGTVTFIQDRFEVHLKPMTDEELNRQFFNNSQAGPKSTNPYTFGNAVFWGSNKEKKRFDVFKLSVKNYAYPKVKIDPSKIVIKAGNKREYWSLSFEQLDTYYRPYAIGYRGNEYARYQERRDLLRRTMLKDEEIFSGQEAEGFVVFPALHPDVASIDVQIHDVVLRFDFRNEPVETTNIEYQFTRDIGRIYSDGTIKLSKVD
jgi:hypothetical protein